MGKKHNDFSIIPSNFKKTKCEISKFLCDLDCCIGFYVNKLSKPNCCCSSKNPLELIEFLQKFCKKC
jgi:hypothetical protein